MRTVRPTGRSSHSLSQLTRGSALDTRAQGVSALRALASALRDTRSPAGPPRPSLVKLITSSRARQRRSGKDRTLEAPRARGSRRRCGDRARRRTSRASGPRGAIDAGLTLPCVAREAGRLDHDRRRLRVLRRGDRCPARRSRVRLLLDTHVVLWQLSGERSLGVRARELIGASTELALSVVSFAEIGV